MKNNWFNNKILKYSLLLYLIYLSVFSLYLYNVTPAKKINTIDNQSYYITLDYLKEEDAFQLDSNKVTIVDYSKIKSLGVKSKLSYNPVSIGLMGLRYYQEYTQNDTNDRKELVISHADWLVDNQTNEGTWKISHNKKIGDKSLKAPWISSLSQGFGISLLTRAFALNKDSTYVHAIEDALKPFQKNIDQGGISFETKFGVFYEEYPLDEPHHVLNGFMYSLFGLYDAYKATGSQTALQLFNEGAATLKKIIDEFDNDNWTLYSLNKESNFRNHWNYASPFYQKIHVAQLNGMYLITNDEVFKKYADKFEEQNKSSWVNFIIYPAYVMYTDFVWIYKLF